MGQGLPAEGGLEVCPSSQNQGPRKGSPSLHVGGDSGPVGTLTMTAAASYARAPKLESLTDPHRAVRRVEYQPRRTESSGTLGEWWISLRLSLLIYKMDVQTAASALQGDSGQ